MANPWEEYATATPTASVSVEPWNEYAGASVEPPSKETKLSTFNYIANQAKLGLTDTAVLGEALLDTFVLQPAKSLIGKAEPGGIGERWTKNVARLQEAAGTITGAQAETKAPNVAAEVLGGGARMMADPLGYVGSGLFKTGATIAEKVVGAVPRAAGLFGMGTTSTGGGVIGEQVEQRLVGTDTGVGRATGQVLGIGAGIPTSTAIETGVKSLTDMAKQLKSKYDMVRADPDAASQAYASGAAKRFLGLVAESTPSKNIDAILDEFNRIGKDIGAGDIPLFVAMSDNPIVKSEVSRLVKSSQGAGIRQQFETELKTILGNIDDKATALFGTRYNPVAGATTPLTKEVTKNLKLREAVDTKLDQLAERFPEQDLAALGMTTERLLEVRSKAAKAEMTPIYDGIKEGAAKAGAVLPDTGVRDIHSFVVANNMQDIFGRKTRLDNLITKNFAPVNGEYYPASFRDVISLKEEINRVQRSVKMDEVAKMRLNELEDVVDGARQQIPGRWNQALVDADKGYYEKIGIPFGSQGVKDIGSKKYNDQIAPQLVKSGDPLRQFLKAAGDEGVTIANNALMAEAYNKVIKDGSVDVRALSRFIKSKEDSGVLDQLPGSREFLRGALMDDSALKIARKTLDDKVKLAEKQIADNFILSVKDADGISIPNYSELSNRLFSDPNFFGKITKDLTQLDKKTSTAVLNNIRAEVVEKARNSTDGGLGFLTSPKNAAVINKVFGTGYQQEIKDLMVVSDALNKADVSKISAVIKDSDTDVLAKIVPGLDVPYVTSTLRDRISSTFQKGVRLVSRAKTAQLKTDTDDALKQLLLDRDGLKKLQAIKNTMDFKLSTPESIKKVSDTLTSIVPRYAYGAVKQQVMPAGQQPAPDTTPEFGSFEQQ
jgi:hypothetical protein